MPTVSGSPPPRTAWEHRRGGSAPLRQRYVAPHNETRRRLLPQRSSDSMAGIRRPRYENEKEAMVQSLVVTLGYPILDRLTTLGPYLDVVITGCELRGRIDPLRTVVIARWNGQFGQWRDGEDVVQPTIIIAPLQIDEEMP